MDKIPTVLACDAGNTRIALGCVSGDDTSLVQSVKIGKLDSLGEILTRLWQQQPTPQKLVAVSVNPEALKALEAIALETIKQDVLVVGRDLPLPIATDLASPQSIGTDRLCCAAAAYDQIGTACVVADFGTAITIDCVNDEGVFLGGAILPGLAMSADALHSGTAKLPSVKLKSQKGQKSPKRQKSVFGKDTAQAISIGLVQGARGALRQLAETYATELGHWPTVIATGGDAEIVCGSSQEAELVQTIVPELSLRGVAMAYYKSLLK